MSPVVKIIAWSTDGWITVSINGQIYTYFTDLAVIKRFNDALWQTRKPGRWFNYLKSSSTAYKKGGFHGDYDNFRRY